MQILANILSQRTHPEDEIMDNRAEFEMIRGAA
jgi:hypothetical protein